MNLTINPTTAAARINRTREGDPIAIGFDRLSANGLDLPDDLRVWLDHQALVDLTVRAVLGLDHPPADSAVPVACTSAVPSTTPMLLLTYCYAAGIYCSEDIEYQLETEPGFRLLCGGEPPDAAALRRFRRTHRPEVEYCLAAVLWSACRREWDRLSDPCHSPLGRDPGCRLESGTDEPLRCIIERDVKRRVNRAVEFDSMTLDC
jgi:hypothetical protein